MKPELFAGGFEIINKSTAPSQFEAELPESVCAFVTNKCASLSPPSLKQTSDTSCPRRHASRGSNAQS